MKIEKNIPFPLRQVSKIETMLKMEIGDSFLVDADEAQAWRCAMSKAAEDTECHFISRTAVGGVRIWRDA